jgi:diguanylate cyclase
MRRWTAGAVLAGAAITAGAPGTLAADAAYLACFAGITAAAWQAGLRRAGGSGMSVLAWRLIAAAMTCWLAGDVVSDGLDLAGWTPGVGLPDVLWLGGYPLLGSALVIMARRRAPGQSRAGALDGFTLTTAAAVCLGQLVVAPTVAGAKIDAQMLVGLLYPLGDVVLLAAVLFLVLSPGRRGRPTLLLVAGMGLTLGCDLAMAVVPTYWPDAGIDRLDGALLLANAMIVAAARHPGREELLTPVRGGPAGLHPTRVLFLGLALMTAPLMAISRSGLSAGERLLLVAGTAVSAALTLARFVGAVREQGRIQQLLAHQAAHDALTGLANRRTLIDRLEQDYQPAPDTVLLYLDLDGFKGINDVHGHAAGDAVLVEVAHRLRRTVRTTDLVARLGGDEFAVLCYRLPANEAEHLAERLAAAVSDPIRYDELALRVSASVGLASALACPTGDTLIAAADHAMFAVKRSSRRNAFDAAVGRSA